MTEQTPQHAIDPEDVIAWLVTQPNANGTLYSENVVRQYMSALRSVPAKLEISGAFDVRSVFACHTADELNTYWDIFRGAPNYKQVNSRTSGQFSAGMGCYLRYLQQLSGEPNTPSAAESDVIQLIERHGLEYVDKRDYGGALWVVGGRELSPTMLEFRNAGFPFMFRVGGGRSSDYQDAWWYKGNDTISEKKSEAPGSVQAVSTEPNNTVPDAVVDVLNKNYASGFRFDTTYINLLSSASGVEIDGRMQSALKRIMFRRDDGIYFLLDLVADAATRKDIIVFADTYLQEYGCFEIPEFYKLYEDKVNPHCIRNADDFESFYEQIGKSGVRCVQAPYIGNRIARFSNGSVWGTFKEVAAKIISFITEEYYGSCNEDDLHNKFCAFSTDLLGKIIKQCAADELIRVEINDSICYQTFDALGLPENFSEVLAEALERLSDIGLDPTQDALHTTLSLELGVNFRAEYNLPDWDTYRRLIAAFYKAAPRREWKSNIFGEIVS
ncbi:MAG: hypothetical protein ACM3QZ_12675 [Solirubrobacterales bacterium]